MPTPATTLRVLIVEDNVLIANVAADFLADAGCATVAVATNVSAALERIRDTDFDVAMLDLDLGGLSALPVARRLQAARKPFIFATGFPEMTVGHGFDDVPLAAKPYTSEALLNAIHHLRPVRIGVAIAHSGPVAGAQGPCRSHRRCSQQN